MDEVDAPKIKADLPVRIKMDAYPKRDFPGKVRRVAPYVTAVEKQARTVDVEVDFDQPDDVRRAAGRLQRRRRDRAGREGRRDCACRPRPSRKAAACWCSAPDNGVLEERRVKTGIANWEYTEVLEGLRPGEKHRHLAGEGRRQGRRAGGDRRQGDQEVAMAPSRTDGHRARLHARRQRGACAALTSTWPSKRANTSRSWGRRARASQRCSTCSACSTGPNAGIYRLEGRDVTTLSADEQARVRRERIGFVFQSFHLVPRLTAAENVALPMMLAGIRAGRAQRAGSARRSRITAWPTAPTIAPTSSPAASASVSPSPAPPSCARR